MGESKMENQGKTQIPRFSFWQLTSFYPGDKTYLVQKEHLFIKYQIGLTTQSKLNKRIEKKHQFDSRKRITEYDQVS